jgi:hypothetical protein
MLHYAGVEYAGVEYGEYDERGLYYCHKETLHSPD